ncbi:copper resistance protein B [Coralloluteibacterium thermophilus]|uniref:Copper resistance protein B n=1 Tax=Coralloluteibacterium thermophilum TaxID=2707049 RepID=A0ABV9NQ70_9GAMM
MDDNPFNVHVRFDRLEWQNTEPDATLAWSAKAWLGRDDGRLWLRSHGARSGGRTEHAELQALWGRPVSPWWDMVAGVRHRSRPGPSRSAAALGVIGLAPYFFEIEATAFVEEGGHVSAEVEVEYELLFTQDLVLQPSLGLELNGRSDAAQGIGSGLSSAQAGLRLRYEIRREFAPYLGIEWERSFGRTADFARDAGRGHSDARLVAGLRVWF